MRKTFPFMPISKPSKEERERGLFEFEEKVKQNVKTANKPRIRKSDNPNYNLETIEMPPKAKNTHISVKPIKLFSYLITIGTRENEIVFDPFIGSGTTAMACIGLNRRYIGCEINKEYYDICKARIESVQECLL